MRLTGSCENLWERNFEYFADNNANFARISRLRQNVEIINFFV